MKPKTMNKPTVHIEYIFASASESVLWNAISTAAGLQTWFADKVDITHRQCSFHWGKTETRKAHIIAQHTEKSIRFRWDDEVGRGTYFELRITRGELTNSLMLEVFDFADKGEENDQRELWDMQIESLKRACGL